MPTPVGSNAQVQPITTALAGILRQYPAGGGVLREILQNADDAKARKLIFYLDTTTHTQSPLLHEDLKQYQGPALVAYNDGVFRDEDFRSLSNVGDSRKFEDTESTGKFGLGFNSVYNWTDAPSVLSGHSLLLLDPHHSWSKDVDPINPGGPMYDFVKDSDTQILNQLGAYTAMQFDPTEPFLGTMIRIPLRTAEQADTSRISKRTIDKNEVLEAFSKFVSEIKDGALLFLKNIMEISFVVDGKNHGHARLIDNEKTKQYKGQVAAAMSSLSGGRNFTDFDLSFELEQEYSDKKGKMCSRYLVQHLMKNRIGIKDVDDWARSQNLYPWVAVAVPISTNSEAHPTLDGRLFVTLPLPIKTHQSAHIHGMFSITPDRANLHTSEDQSSQDRLPGIWNEVLFSSLVPSAWSKVLVERVRVIDKADQFEYWPVGFATKMAPWHYLLDSLVRRVIENRLPIWKTSDGIKSFGEIFLTRDKDTNPGTRTALDKLKMAVILMRDDIYELSVEYRGKKILSPGTVRDYVRGHGNTRLSNLSNHERSVLLKYVLQDNNYTDLQNLPLFPMKNGSFVAISGTQRTAGVFLNRDHNEMKLFSDPNSRNYSLDPSLMDEFVMAQLKLDYNDISINSTLRHPSIHDGVEFFKTTQFSKYGPQEVVSLGPESSQDTNRMMEWFHDRLAESRTKGIDIKRDAALISSLWLMPIVPSFHKRFMNASQLTLAILDLNQTYSDLAKFISSTPGSEKQLNLLMVGAVSTKLRQSWKRMEARKEPLLGQLGLFSIANFPMLIKWLAPAAQMIEAASEDKKLMLQGVLGKSFVAWSPSAEFNSIPNRRVELGKTISSLPFFSKLQTELRGTDIRISSSPLQSLCINRPDKEQYLVINSDQPSVLPNVSNITYLRARDDTWIQILKELAIGSFPTTQELMELVFLPFLQENSKLTGNMTFTQALIRRQATNYVLNNLSLARENIQENIKGVLMVPIDKSPLGQGETVWKLVTEVVAPNTVVAKFYTVDEQVHPDKNLFLEHEFALARCGIRAKLTFDIIIERIQYCALSSIPEDKRRRIATALLQHDISYWNFGLSQWPQKESLEWIPARIIKHSAFFKPQECRDKGMEAVVGKILAIIDMDIHSSWKKLFGWHNPIDIETLKSQFNACAEQKDLLSIESVFKYVAALPGSVQVGIVTELAKLNITPGDSDQLLSPKHLFFHCQKLAPYLDRVSRPLAGSCKPLLKSMGVQDRPTLTDYMYVNQRLQQDYSSELDEAGLSVALELLSVIAKLPLPLTDSFQDLKAPDMDGKLCPLAELTYGDYDDKLFRSTSKQLHTGISKATADYLGIQSYRDRLIDEEIGTGHEEEFEQSEDFITSINTTLERYPIISTFPEYLANAEDAKATKLVWLLDGCESGPHRSNFMLTDELEKLQGPALFAYNDSTFTEKDFEGFKEIGRSSKRDNSEQIGMFGRGAMTMYHWTDLPMVLSGDYLILLDPQRKYLKKPGPGQRRPAGNKLLLSKLRNSRGAVDLLAPFVGLFDFTLKLDHYDGTIFRFPLKQGKSMLKEQHVTIDVVKANKLLSDYYKDACVSLHFLKHAKSIEYRIRHKDKAVWTVCRGSVSEKEGTDFIQPVSIVRQFQGIELTDDWLVATQAWTEFPSNVEIVRARRAKDTSCGIAILTSRGAQTELLSKSLALDTSKRRTRSSLYCWLPLPFKIDLPVHPHASFEISSDRNGVSIDKTTDELSATWNRWLLKECLPDLYLRFLNELVTCEVADFYNYWPILSGFNAPTDAQSDLIREGFWARLRCSELPLFHVAALDTADVAMVHATKRLPSLRVTAREVVADFLPDIHSSALLPLLRAAKIPIVRLPDNFKPTLERYTNDIKVFDAKFFRKNFCSTVLANKDSSSEFVFDALKMSRETTAIVLYYATLGLELEECPELYGCRIVPLANGEFGTLAVKDTRSAEDTMIIPNDTMERELLVFAEENLVDESMEEHCQPLLQMNAFNIQRMEPKIFPQLLKQYGIPHPYHPGERTKWLKTFWNYLHKHPSTTELEGLKDLHVYRATCSGATEFISPSIFEHQHRPAIIFPIQNSERTLVGKFPGIYFVDSGTVTKGLAQAEEHLRTFAGVRRFLHALSVLADGMGLELDEYILQILENDSANFELFRDIVMNQLSQSAKAGKLLSMISSHKEKDILRSLPLWPTITTKTNQSQAKHKYISVKDCLATKEANVLPFWTVKRSRFIEPKIVVKYEALLTQLDVLILQPRGVYDNYVKHHFPRVLQSSEEVQEYMAVLKFLASSAHLSIAQSGDVIASDGTRTLRKPSELYDHDDAIFQATFRGQEREYFLADGVRAYKTFFMQLGLRCQHVVAQQTQNYNKCLQVMHERSKETIRYPSVKTRYLQDLDTVSAKLQYESTEVQRWGSHEWHMLSQLEIFPGIVDVSSHPIYRRRRMKELSDTPGYFKISEAAISSSSGYCWSQLPILRHSFHANVINKCQPLDPNHVVKHLQYLANIHDTILPSEFAKFTGEIKSLYRYLEDKHCIISREPWAVALKTQPLWLNIENDCADSKEDCPNLFWKSVKELCIGLQYDTSEVKPVGSFLMACETLIVQMGCKKVILPRTREYKDDTTVTSFSAELSKLWDNNALLDVAFNIRGELVCAHKIVLASASDFYLKLFTGHVSKGRDFLALPVKIDTCSADIARVIFDHIYKKKLTIFDPINVTSNDVIADKIDQLFEILQACNFFGIKDLHQQVEKFFLAEAHIFVRIDNVSILEKVAEDVRAIQLQVYCKDYRENNQKVVDAADAPPEDTTSQTFRVGKKEGFVSLFKSR